MFSTRRNRDLLQIQAGMPTPAEKSVRQQAARDHCGTGEPRPVEKPQARNEVDPVQREHEHHRASLHHEPADCHLPGKNPFRSAAPRLIHAEAGKQRKREGRRKSNESQIEISLREIVETNLRGNVRPAQDHCDIEQSCQ